MLPFRENGIEQQWDEIIVGTTGPVLLCNKNKSELYTIQCRNNIQIVTDVEVTIESYFPEVGNIPSSRDIIAFMNIVSLKSMNLPFSRFYIFVSFRNNVCINCTLRPNTVLDFGRCPPTRMTWSDLECPIQINEVNVRMSHGLLADSVDTSLASLLYSCSTDAVFSEVHDRWASRERRVYM